MADMLKLVEYIAKSLAEHPDELEVSQYTKGRQEFVRLKFAASDMGRVIRA